MINNLFSTIISDSFLTHGDYFAALMNETYNESKTLAGIILFFKDNNFEVILPVKLGRLNSL